MKKLRQSRMIHGFSPAALQSSMPISERVVNRQVTHLQRQSLQMRDSRKVGFSATSVVSEIPVFRAPRQVRIVVRQDCFRVADDTPGTLR